MGAELTEPEMIRMTELLKENRSELASIPMDMLGLDPIVAVHRLNLDPNAKKVVQKKECSPRKVKGHCRERGEAKVNRFHMKGTICYMVIQRCINNEGK